MSQDESDRLARLYARVHLLDRYNATLVTRLNEAKARADQTTPWRRGSAGWNASWPEPTASATRSEPRLTRRPRRPRRMRPSCGELERC